MSARVKKHCSILNYLQYADHNLYDLIQQLCLGRILVPRRGTPGLVFLRPDETLRKRLEQMASGPDPEPAIQALQSCVLLDNLPTIRDFEDKKSDIPTWLRRKLPVSGVDGKKVMLKNGAEITPDPGFTPRKDRDNISVYILSKEFVPHDTEDADFSNAKIKNNRKVKGGAEFTANKLRIFQDVLDLHCNEAIMQDRNPAMEVLLSLCGFLEKRAKEPETAEHCQQLYDAVCSQLSWDTLASLAIVLQPHLSDEISYLRQADIQEWAKQCSNKLTVFYALRDDPVQCYKRYMEHGASCVKSADIEKHREEAVRNVNSLTIRMVLSDNMVRCADAVPAARRSVVQNVKRVLAEAELRVTSAILHDDHRAHLDADQAKQVFMQKCKLNEPWALTLSDASNPRVTQNLAYFFSIAYLMARSDAFVYHPNACSDGESLDMIADEEVCIRLDRQLCAAMCGSLGEHLAAKMREASEAMASLRGD